MIVKKAEAARQLGVSRARIAQYVAQGMPAEPDGRINLDLARKWIEGALDPARRASWRAARAAAAATEAAPPGGRFGPALEIEAPGHRGFAVAAMEAIYQVPVMAVIAASEMGLCRDQAEKLAEWMILLLWHQLDSCAQSIGLPAREKDGSAIAVDSETLLAWRERVNWPSLFRLTSHDSALTAPPVA